MPLINIVLDDKRNAIVQKGD